MRTQEMRRVERNIVIVLCRGNLYSNLRKPAEQQSEMEIRFLRHQCTGECTEFHKTIDINCVLGSFVFFKCYAMPLYVASYHSFKII